MNGPGRARERRPERDDFLAAYAPPPQGFDEMVGPDGGIRPHWRPFLDAIGGFGPAAIERIWDSTQRLIRENGAAYNVYDRADDAAHPWRMDPVPYLMSEADWRSLEAALVQRARLLNAVVDDIYGAQTLLHRGHLPAALVYGNAGFLRPLHGVRPARGVHLHVLAFDLARGADGKWWVLSDRAQAPSGGGYALENRVVLSRTLSESFRDMHVHRLAGFFQAMSDGLLDLTGRDEPAAVLLTPGPRNATFFEHSYLARYLGFPLVEGADLTVRDNRVYLKTLQGLKQVDLILRRVDGVDCDPLELTADSLLGVPGLVEAVRAGNVIVANSLGSGVIESDAMMAFYPGLSERLLGEPLAMPSLATWWCGQAKEREHVIANLGSLTIRPAFARTSILNGNAGAILPGELTPEKRRALIDDIRVNGHNYFGQETPAFSTTPVWRDGALAPRPMSLRMFVAYDGKDYRVMPGGLARVTDQADTRSLQLRLGEATKDVWMLSETPVSTFTRLAAPDQPIALRRGGVNLASRAADNLFWLGRYAERAEGAIRLIRSMILRLTGEAGAGEDPKNLARLTQALIDLGHLPESASSLAQAGEWDALERELGRMLAEPTGPDGLLTLLAGLDRIALLVRERLSVDSWRILNNLRARARQESAVIRLDLDDAAAVLNAMLGDLAAFSGMQKENMTRSLGWRLMDAGRRIERATHTTTLIREMAVEGDPAADGRLDLLLELGDSTMTYRTRYFTSPRVAPVVDLLLLDDTNPRSVQYQVIALAEHIRALPGAGEYAMLPREAYLVESIVSRLRLTDVQSLSDARDDRGDRLALQALLDEIENQALEFSEALARKYFNHVQPTRSAFAGASA